MTRFNVSRFVKGTPLFNEWYMKRGNVPFLSKMVYQRLKVWTSGPSLPVRNVVEKPPPGPLGHLKVGGKEKVLHRKRRMILSHFNIFHNLLSLQRKAARIDSNGPWKFS